MKKRLSIREFQSYLIEHTPSKISFWSENQNWDSVSDPFKIIMSFPIIMVYESTGTICLKDKMENKLYFGGVKHVYLNDDIPALGTVFDICCSLFTQNKKDERVYTLIAS